MGESEIFSRFQSALISSDEDKIIFNKDEFIRLCEMFSKELESKNFMLDCALRRCAEKDAPRD